MSSHVGVYLDGAGNITKIVRPHFDELGYTVTDKDFSGHDDKVLTRVTIPAQVYLNSPPINLNGQAVYYDLQKQIAVIAQADQSLAPLVSAVQAKTAAVDVVLAQIAADIVAQSAAALADAGAPIADADKPQ